MGFKIRNAINVEGQESRKLQRREEVKLNITRFVRPPAPPEINVEQAACFCFFMLLRLAGHVK